MRAVPHPDRLWWRQQPGRSDAAARPCACSHSLTDLDGMVIAVNGASTEAAIVTTPANAYQFRPGDLKWRNIVRQSDTTFAFEDLVRQANSGTASYVAGTIEVQSNRTELRLQFPTTGTFQQWRKR